MTGTPQGSSLVVPGRTPEERLHHRLVGLENANQEDWRGETGWITLSYENSASTAGGGVAAAYKLTGQGFVICRGYVSCAAGGVSLATLPAGARPASGTKRFAGGANSTAVLDVGTNGQIIPFASGFPTSIGIDSILFIIGS